MMVQGEDGSFLNWYLLGSGSDLFTDTSESPTGTFALRLSQDNHDIFWSYFNDCKNQCENLFSDLRAKQNVLWKHWAHEVEKAISHKG